MRWKEIQRMAIRQSADVANHAVNIAVDALDNASGSGQPDSAEAIATLAAALVPHLQARYNALISERDAQRDDGATEGEERRVPTIEELVSGKFTHEEILANCSRPRGRAR